MRSRESERFRLNNRIFSSVAPQRSLKFRHLASTFLCSLGKMSSSRLNRPASSGSSKRRWMDFAERLEKTKMICYRKLGKHKTKQIDSGWRLRPLSKLHMTKGDKWLKRTSMSARESSKLPRELITTFKSLMPLPGKELTQG